MASTSRNWREYSEYFRKEVLPNLLDSSTCLSVYSREEGEDFDIQQATEIGAMLLLDKPLILVTTPGTSLPIRLARAADAVIENWDADNMEAQEQLVNAIKRWRANP